MELGERVFGPNHLRTAAFMSNLVRVLVDRGALDEAERLARRSLAIHQTAMGDRGWRTGVSHGLIGQVLAESGQIDQARTELELAHEILLETLGADHARTVRVVEVLDDL